MIVGYHRPDTLVEALQLIGRNSPATYLMGGGTKLNRSSSERFEVVDLQALALQTQLGLGQIQLKGNSFVIGAAVSLQKLMDYLDFPETLRVVFGNALQAELTYNLRQVATVGGSIVSGTARSGLTTVLLALDAALEIASPDGKQTWVPLGDYLSLRDFTRSKDIILKVKIPSMTAASYEAVARTPMDFPLVSTAVAQWPLGRTRVVLGGYGHMPVLVLDGPDNSGSEIAAREKYHDAGDEWASAEYRSAVAEILVKRNINFIQEVSGE